MKCKCGGELIRINIGNYQCTKCGKYHKAAFSYMPYIEPKFDIKLSEPKILNDAAKTLFKNVDKEFNKNIKHS